MEVVFVLYIPVTLFTLSLSDGVECKGLLENLFADKLVVDPNRVHWREIDNLWLGGRDRGGAVLFNSL